MPHRSRPATHGDHQLTQQPGWIKLSDRGLKLLAQVPRKHHVILIYDEIYGMINHHGQHVSIARDYPEGTIVSTGLNKWRGTGGWRLGAFFPPPNLR